MIRPIRMAAIWIASFVVILPLASQRLPPAKQIAKDGECQNTSRIPAKALKAVLETRVAKESLLEEPSMKDPNELFVGSEIKLGRSGEIALLVCGSGPMSGADNAWYWIVSTPYTHPRVVLFEGTDALSMLPRYHNGYRDLESWWGVASGSHEKTFQFNGSKYVLAHERCYVPIPSSGLTNKRVPCP
jgi:hypothetical protein